MNLKINLFTDYTFALWNESNKTSKERKLVTFAKAYSGLNNTEVEQLDKYLMPIALSSIVSLAILMYFWDNIYLILGFILLAITGLFY